jgi:chromosome segregation ATPase
MKASHTIGLVLSVCVAAALVCRSPQLQEPPSTQRDVRVGLLQARIAEIVIQRDAIARERDSLKVESNKRTTAIVRVRQALPASAPPDASRDSIATLYKASVAQLDTAIKELASKDDIIRRDSLEAQQLKSINAKAVEIIAELKEGILDERSRRAAADNEVDRLKRVWLPVAAVSSAVLGAWLRGQ